MATIDFRPNKGKKILNPDKPVNIYIRYRLGRKVDFNASIGVSVLIDNWDFEKKRVKNRTAIKDRNEINNRISDLTKHFDDFTTDNLRKGHTPNYNEVKSRFKSYFTEAINDLPNNKSLFGYIDYLIDKPEIKRTLSSNTLRTYTRTKNVLKKFNDKVYPIGFETIGLEWYNDFIEWCEGQKFSKNYIGSHIKILKAIMNRAIEDGLTENNQFKSRRFKVLREDGDDIYLNLKELNSLWRLDLSHDPRKEDVRDLFLIGAFTGLRVSDFNYLKDENISIVKGVKMLKVKTHKTKKSVAIPLHPIVEEILEKNDGKPPKKISDQKINELMKYISESAGIDEVCYTTKTIGGKEITKKNYKFDLVKTHTARRSFCTNAYLSGMSPMDIMSISGHTSEKNFKNYIKVTEEERAIKMSQHPFFQGQSNLKVV